jgi:hypothetical protein
LLGRLRTVEGRRLLRIPLLLAALGVALTLSRRWPSDQAVHVVLGDAAPRATELRIRYADLSSGHDDWQREATFHYAAGHAPRIVNHEPRLASGEYDVEIEVSVADGPSESHTVTTTRRMTLNGGSTSVDVSRQLEADPARP